MSHSWWPQHSRGSWFLREKKIEQKKISLLWQLQRSLNLERRKCYDALVGLCRTWTETRTRFRTLETFSFGNCLLVASRFREEQSTMDLVRTPDYKIIFVSQPTINHTISGPVIKQSIIQLVDLWWDCGLWRRAKQPLLLRQETIKILWFWCTLTIYHWCPHPV